MSTRLRSRSKISSQLCRVEKKNLYEFSSLHERPHTGEIKSRAKRNLFIAHRGYKPASRHGWMSGRDESLNEKEKGKNAGMALTF